MDINKFALYLERGGYSGALRLIEEVLLPLAKKGRFLCLTRLGNMPTKTKNKTHLTFNYSTHFNALVRIF